MKYVVSMLAVTALLLAHNFHGVALAPDGIHGWVVCLDTALVLYTDDGGATWQEQTIPANSKRIFDVTCLDQFSAWTCGILGEILHTENAGSDWTAQAIGLSKYATRIEFIDSQYGWTACGDGVVARTDNGGGIWEQIFTPWYSAEYYGVSFVNEYDGWTVAGYPDSLLTGQGLIINTTDGGIDWNLLYESPTYEDFLDVHFFHLLDGIVVGGDEIDYSPLILRTTNGGSDWDTIDAPASTYYLRAVDFVGNKGWAVGRFGTIIYTDNGGVTWSSQNSPAVNTLFDVDFSDTLHGLACGDGVILWTTDGGQNWYQSAILDNKSESVQQVSLRAYPNPFSKLTSLSFGIEQSAERIELRIFDATGELVRSFGPLPFAPSPMQVSWDGIDDAGNRVPAGVYFVRLESDGYAATEKITVLR
jgi:photosystem II stability/assembly factor-like uncharacterized protein